MAVHDRTYEPWNGRLTGAWPRVWALTRTGLVQPFRNIWILLMIVFSFTLVTGFLLFLMVIAQKLSQLGPGAAEAITRQLFAVGNNIYRVSFFNTPFFGAILTLLAIAVGAPLIANDLRHHALVMLLSRAITRGQYVAAKMLTLVLFLLVATLGPALLLWVGQMAIGIEELTMGQRLQDLASVTLHALVLTVPLSAAVLACSSITKRAYVAGILWAAVVFAGQQFERLLSRLLDEPWCGFLSWSNLTAHVADRFYAVREVRGKLVAPPEPALETGWLPPAILLATVTALSLAVVWTRLRRTETDE